MHWFELSVTNNVQAYYLLLWRQKDIHASCEPFSFVEDNNNKVYFNHGINTAVTRE